ncbi:MAG: efflux RND transporter permease subunit [Gemmatimonadota bacterium]
MSLPEFSIRYPVTVTMATLAVALLGWISAGRLGTDLLPSLQTPVVTVDLRAAGKSPREMEERYTRRLERDISTVDGVRRVYSVTRSGQAVVVAEFAWDADIDFGLLDVQKRTGAYATDTEIDQLDVTQEDPRSLPVLRLAVTGGPDQDVDALVGVVETLAKPKLEALAGVASAQIEGGADREVRVTLDEDLLQAYGVTASQVVQRITAANADVSGGTLRDGQQAYQVKGMGRLRDVADVGGLIVAERRGTDAVGRVDTTAGRVPVYVGDVGRVELVYPERQTIVRLDGAECVGLAIYKEANANTVGVVAAVTQALAELGPDLGALRFTAVENQARFIEQAIGQVEQAALVGAGLAIAVLLLALRNWTVTLVIGLAIPISVLATFTLMYFQGLSLNIMTLGGLALGAGMLVDNAIVVIENIYRHLEGGAGAREASTRGASEVGVAIAASTLTTIAVFLPIVYVHGLAGQLFKDQAWTVAAALGSSLVVAMTVVPMLSARVLRSGDGSRRAGRRRFGAFVGFTLDHQGWVGAATCLCLAAAVGLGRGLHSEFIPRDDQGLFDVDLALPEGTDLERTDRVAARVAQIVRQVGGDDVEAVYVRSGIDPARVTDVDEPVGPNRATLTVSLRPDRREAAATLVARLDAELRQLPEVTVEYGLHETALEGILGAQAAPVEVDISGDDLDLLQSLTADLATRLEALPAVYNVATSFQHGQPEVDLNLRTEEAAALGFNLQSLLQELQRRLSGEVAGELSRDQRTRTIRVAFERVDLDALRRLRLTGPDGAELTLGDLADPRLVEGPREIRREDQRRLGRVTGYLAEGAALSEAVAQVRQAAAQVPLPAGYRLTIGGEERERAAAFADLRFALLLAVALVYMVMASLFESFLHPLTVMLTVPLAGVGVVFTFAALGEPLSVMAYIGIIMLGGIAVNDAIILVDRINQLRATAASLRAAVVQAAQDRLRPILMTSATTVLALLPMALGLGEGGRLRAPMALAVIGGLVTSTLLTLVVIPAVYEAVERVRGRA